MIYGVPGAGKSVLSYYLWKYFHEVHGKTLYILVEEGFSPSAQIKMKKLGITENQPLATEMQPIEVLKQYKYVFIDSFHEAGLKAHDIVRLRDACPNTTFFFVFTVNLKGEFSGGMQGLHKIDTSVKMVEKGIAEVQNKSRTGAIAGTQFKVPYDK
ncbi:MAG: hypothetical protein ACKVTZ_18855 [Bacteroidia bacterium]